MASQNLDNPYRKRKKKSSADSSRRSKTQISSMSNSHIAGYSKSGSMQIPDSYSSHEAQQPAPQHHSRYATVAGYSQITGHHQPQPHHHRNFRLSKPKDRPKNKIKSRNRLNGKALSHHQVTHSHSGGVFDHDNVNAFQPPSTPPPAHHLGSGGGHGGGGGGHQHIRRRSKKSNPRPFRHKFNMSEMQLVIGQIAEMKKSWKTPAEEVMTRIYQIIDMDERPHLNGKHCKITLILDDYNYRVRLLNNSSEHVLSIYNLRVAFETENLYLLYSSQRNPSPKNSIFHSKKKRISNVPLNQPSPPKSPPPNQDPDDMFTIQAFETSFHDIHEFRRYDFGLMACCVLIGLIIAGGGIYLFLQHNTSSDLHAIGAFAAVFAPVLGMCCGVYVGCLWYCCAVSAGIAILTVSTAGYLLFDELITVDDVDTDTDNLHPLETDENGDISVNEAKLFYAVEAIAACGGIGLFVSGIVLYYYFLQRDKAEERFKGPRPAICEDDQFAI